MGSGRSVSGFTGSVSGFRGRVGDECDEKIFLCLSSNWSTPSCFMWTRDMLP